MKYAIILVILSLTFTFINAPATASAEAKPEIVIQSLEKQVHARINIERKKHGLRPLKWDQELSDIAGKHARDMAAKLYLGHGDAAGEGPVERALKAGYKCAKRKGDIIKGLGENVFENTVYSKVSYHNGVPAYNWNKQEVIADTTVQGWMESPAHKKNILDGDYEKGGIGIAISEKDNKIYVVQMFC